MGTALKHTLDLRSWLPCSGQYSAWEVQPDMTTNPLFLRTEWSHHSFFSSSESLSVKCVLSMVGESPTNPLALNFGGRCCACTMPHLCTGVCTPSAESHSLLGSLPLATACKLGQVEVGGRKRCFWIFPQIRKPLSPQGACNTQCYSSELPFLF